MKIMRRYSCIAVFCLAAVLLPLSTAHAIPSFARQTGLTCASCHTVFPELTAFGRSFKLHAYAMTNVTQEQSAALQENYYPPLSAMLLVSMTRLNTKQPDTQNGNVLFPDQFSLFYAGRIADTAGAFAQVTYNGIDDHFSMDNADIRFVRDRSVGSNDLLLGLTLNNSPTVQDIWNSTPAWGFPFIASGIAPSPAAATLLDGTLAQQVAGLGVYGDWNNWLYAELTLYRSSQIGGNEPPTNASADIIDGTAPYWRLAAEKSWGSHTIEVGTYGLHARVFPGAALTPPGPLAGATDYFTDSAFDAQYQYVTEEHTVAAHTTWIHEKQKWNASYPAGAAANAVDRLNTFKLDGTYYYKRTMGGALGYFSTTGSDDAGIYAPAPVTGSITGGPGSSGLIAEVDYLPWLNTKFAVQYMLYNKFNGARSNYDGFGRNPRDNNTLYVYAWLMF